MSKTENLTFEHRVSRETHDPATTHDQLEQQTRLFDTVLSSIVDLAYIFDRDGRFTYVNQALLDLWQTTRENALGKNFFELNYPEELAARLSQQIQTVFKTGQTLKGETLYTGAAGATGYYEYIFVPVLDKEGKVDVVAGSTRDITARKEMEQALQASEAQSRDILESIPDAFFALDHDWRFTYVNRQAERLLGREPGDLIGGVIWEKFPGMAGSKFQETYLRAASEGTASSLTDFYSDHNRWYEVHVYPAARGIIIYFRDVSEQKRGEKALRESKESLALALNGAQLGTFYCEMPLDKIIWNDICKEHFFLSSDAEVDFDLFYARLHPDDREPTRQAIARCLDQHTQYNVEYRVVAPDGRMRCVNAIGKGYYTDAGELYRFDGITIDITEKKTHERALSFLVELNDATRDMLEPETIMQTVARMLGEFMQVSRCAYAPIEDDQDHFTIYGDYTNGCESIVGRHSLTSFGSKAVADLRSGKTYILNDIEQELQPGEERAAYRLTQIQAAIWVSLVKSGSLVALMGVHQSRPRLWTAQEVEFVEMVAERSWAIIERARTDKQLKAHTEEISVLNTSLQRAMTETHHRVKNNLQVIAAMIEMQVMEHNGEQSIPIEEFTRLKAHVHTLAIVHDLLTLNIKEEETAQRISAKAVVEKLLPMLQRTAWKKTVRYSVDEVVLTSKQCIAVSLVLNELVSNALKHGKNEAEVVFSIEGRNAVLTVGDDGEGFPEDFDPKRAANTGLELVSSLVRIDLQGTVTFGNTPESGGLVTVTIPIPPEDV